MRFQDSRPDLWAHNDNAEPAPPFNAFGFFSIGATLIVLALLVCFWMAWTNAAAAHDWYPLECCSGMDCAPVDRAESAMPPMRAGEAGVSSLIPLAPDPRPPALIVTTRHGTASVPPDMARRPSRDGRMHACIRAGRVICIFVPPGS